MTPNVI